MILHDRGSSAPLHSKRRFANLPGLILKRLIWSYQWIWNPGLFVLRPSPHARHGLVSYLHAPQKGNVMCTDCTTQTFTSLRADWMASHVGSIPCGHGGIYLTYSFHR